VLRTRHTIQQAANILGVTESAIRKRIKRNTLEHEKEEDGRVYVYLDESGPSGPVRDGVSESAYPLIVTRLESEVEFLRAQLERHFDELAEMRRLLAGALERIPAIEPPGTLDTATPEPRESPQTASEEPSDTQPPPEEEKRSWWRRLIGG